MSTTRLGRQLRLFERLLSPRGCTVDQLALEFQCSRRTIFRDLRSLEDAGLHVRLDEENRYHMPHFGTQAPRLSTEELILLALAARTSPAASAPDAAGILEQAIGKILIRAPHEQSHCVARVLNATHNTCAEQAVAAGKVGILRTIVTSLAANTPMTIVCRDRGGDTVHEAAIPLRLGLNEHGWAIDVQIGSSGQTATIPLCDVVEAVAPDNHRAMMGRDLTSGPS